MTFSLFVNIFKGPFSSVSQNHYIKYNRRYCRLKCTPPNLHVKTLMHYMTIFGDRAFKEVIKVR